MDISKNIIERLVRLKNEDETGGSMKKRIAVCALLIGVAVAQVMAYSKYGHFKLAYYYREQGWAGAGYCGTTEDLTIDEVFDSRWLDVSRDKRCSNQRMLGKFKFSKQQNALIWAALRKYDYAPGEIYVVDIISDVGEQPWIHFDLVVQINSDLSYTWRGFSYDMVN